MTLPSTFVPGTHHVHVVVETPQGSRNKFVYHPATGGFVLKKSLPPGMHWPYDVGFIPGTLAADGDPLDVMVLTDAPTAMGCVVESRAIGVLMIEQMKQGRMMRNDRVLAVQLNSFTYGCLENIHQLPAGTGNNLLYFFKTYLKLPDDHFKCLGVGDAAAAVEIIENSMVAAG